MTKLYIAYGSNLNRKQMRSRCPHAVPLCGFEMPDHRLLFRGVADVIHERGASAHVGLWKITPYCEYVLDRYEGCDLKRPSEGLYRKEYITLKLGNGTKSRNEQALIYVMNSGRLALPSQYYYDVIRQGYRDFRLPTKALEAALDATIDAMPPVENMQDVEL